jgi:lipid A 3-O-deacylase
MTIRTQVVLAVVAAAMAVGAAPSMAQAQVSEARIGVLQHNIQLGDPKNANKENGPDLQGEVLFNSPSWLTWAGSPRPSFLGSLNTAGETSYAALSLEWQFPVSERFSINASFGYAIHNGDPLVNPYAPADSDRRARFNREELALASRDLFRTSLSVGYTLNEQWRIYGIVEHLSHGEILAEGGGDAKNAGLDNIGIKFGRTF